MLVQFDELDDPNEELLFCGASCYAQYDLARHQQTLQASCTAAVHASTDEDLRPAAVAMSREPAATTIAPPPVDITSKSSLAVDSTAMNFEIPTCTSTVGLVTKTEAQDVSEPVITPTKGGAVLPLGAPFKSASKKADGSNAGGKQKHKAAVVDSEQCKVCDNLGYFIQFF